MDERRSADVMRRGGAPVSVIVPLYNEEAVVEQFAARLEAVLSGLRCRYEIIFVNDGSRDGTEQRLQDVAERCATVKVVSLSRNFGKDAALIAGMKEAQGACVITMDGDLQHPPEVIPALVEAWRRGAKVAGTRRRDEASTGWFKKSSSRAYFKLFSVLSGVSIAPGTADFRLMDRSVVNEILALDERGLFLRAMVPWLGHREVLIDFDVPPRAAGRSKFSLRGLVTLAWNGITSFSTTPLRLATVLGFVFSGLSFIYLAYAVSIALFTDSPLPGWASVIGSVLFLGGVQLICLGIIGEYVGRIFHEVKKRPHYLVEKRIGFADEGSVVRTVGHRAVSRRAAAD